MDGEIVDTCRGCRNYKNKGTIYICSKYITIDEQCVCRTCVVKIICRDKINCKKFMDQYSEIHCISYRSGTQTTEEKL